MEVVVAVEAVAVGVAAVADEAEEVPDIEPVTGYSIFGVPRSSVLVNGLARQSFLVMALLYSRSPMALQVNQLVVR